MRVSARDVDHFVLKEGVQHGEADTLIFYVCRLLCECL